MTRLIGEMVPEGEVGEIAKVPDSFRIARFAKFGDAGKGKGRTVLAAWSVWGEDTHWKLPDEYARPSTIYDLMGNECADEVLKDDVLKLSESPVYLVYE